MWSSKILFETSEVSLRGWWRSYDDGILKEFGGKYFLQCILIDPKFHAVVASFTHAVVKRVTFIYLAAPTKICRG